MQAATTRASVYSKTVRVMETEEILPGVFFFRPPRGGNAGLVLAEDDDFSIAIDATFAPSFAREVYGVSQAADKPIKCLIMTHCHADHLFGSRALSPKIVLGHLPLRERVVDSLQTDWTPEKLLAYKEIAPDLPDVLCPEDVILPNLLTSHCFIFAGERILEFVGTGGHTSDSAFVNIPADSVLFTGDLLFAGMVPFGHDPTVDPDAWIAALARIVELGPRTIIPGHGPPSDIQEIEKHRAFFKDVKTTIIDLLAEGKSGEEIAVFDGFPDFYPDEKGRLPELYRAWADFYSR